MQRCGRKNWPWRYAGLADHPPLGALEWHGDHLPLGLDGLVAEAFCERLAEATGGILLPGTWQPMTTLPHAYSISIPAETVCAVWRGLLAELARVGARTICLVTGQMSWRCSTANARKQWHGGRGCG